MRAQQTTRIVIVAAGSLLAATPLYADVQVTINPAVQHQTIRGWGATEYIGTTINDLYNDLALGGVSFWEHYVLAFFGSNPSGDCFGVHFNLTSFTRYNQYWLFRQIMHYVRPGAVRIGATSDDGTLRPLAFVRDGRTTLVAIDNTATLQARTLQIAGLPPGPYGVCHSVGSSAYQELGVRTVTNGVPLSVTVAANAVVTVYPHPGPNQAPTVTNWRAEPRYLTAPTSTWTGTSTGLMWTSFSPVGAGRTCLRAVD